MARKKLVVGKRKVPTTTLNISGVNATLKKKVVLAAAKHKLTQSAFIRGLILENL